MIFMMMKKERFLNLLLGNYKKALSFFNGRVLIIVC